jgi:hypothetical protein
MDVIRQVSPNMVMFENVAEILSANNGQDMRLMTRLLDVIGFDMMWTMCSAASVGAPHLRRRWFGLAIRRGYFPPSSLSGLSESGMCPIWHSQHGLPLTMPRNKYASTRMRLLGNAIVPLAARQAFRKMLAWHLGVSDLSLQQSVCVGPLSRHGVCKRGILYDVRDPNINAQPPNMQHIWVCPDHYKTLTPFASVKKMDWSECVQLWPTPRASKRTCSHVLTKRTMQDLPTTMMYCKSYMGVVQPQTQPSDMPNIQFVEWLMGYPAGWTCVQSKVTEAPLCVSM